MAGGGDVAGPAFVVIATSRTCMSQVVADLRARLQRARVSCEAMPQSLWAAGLTTRARRISQPPSMARGLPPASGRGEHGKKFGGGKRGNQTGPLSRRGRGIKL